MYSFDLKFYLLFLFNSYVIYRSYEPMKKILNRSEKFKSYPLDKKYYIIKNLIKSIAMSLIFLYMIIIFIPNLQNNIWDDSRNRLIGAFYVSNDLAGLYAVLNCPELQNFIIIQQCFYLLYYVVFLKKKKILED